MEIIFGPVNFKLIIMQLLNYYGSKWEDELIAAISSGGIPIFRKMADKISDDKYNCNL